METNPASEVAKGADGHLFLVGGNQSVLEYVSGQRELREGVKRIFRENITNRNRYFKERGIPYLHIVCPDKHTVLPDSFPFDIQCKVGKIYHDFCENAFLFPAEEFQKGPHHTYWKTDTHWNIYGELTFVKQILSRFGFEESKIDQTFDRVLGLCFLNERYCGDLGSKLTPPETESGLVFRKTEDIRVYSNNVARSNGAIQIALNKSVAEHRLLICGDSFAISCLPIFSLFFREILLVRSPFFHYEMADALKPTHVFSENVERYLPNMPTDRAAPLALLMPALLGKTDAPDQGFYEILNGLLRPSSICADNYQNKYMS